jgi:DNA-binding response OmpR family regulator
MRILIAEDDRVTRRMLEVILAEWGYETVTVADGLAAWELLRDPDGPKLALLDWLMPGIDGLEVCRRVRALPTRRAPYLVLLTVCDGRPDVVAGLQAGADDYITKPFDQAELRARIQTGLRIVRLQLDLAAQLRDSEATLARVRQLQGLLPICMYCKKIRDDRDYWQQVEAYIAAHTEARFSHGICPCCWESKVKPELERIRGGGPVPCGGPKGEGGHE